MEYQRAQESANGAVQGIPAQRAPRAAKRQPDNASAASVARPPFWSPSQKAEAEGSGSAPVRSSLRSQEHRGVRG
jgi:hypothetical protein